MGSTYFSNIIISMKYLPELEYSYRTQIQTKFGEIVSNLSTSCLRDVHRILTIPDGFQPRRSHGVYIFSSITDHLDPIGDPAKSMLITPSNTQV